MTVLCTRFGSSKRPRKASDCLKLVSEMLFHPSSVETINVTKS